LPQLATSGLEYRESGSPIVQQISRYGDTPKYADMVDRDIGDIYRHMSKCSHTFFENQNLQIHSFLILPPGSFYNESNVQTFRCTMTILNILVELWGFA